jgi:ceramide glucosyltransferase
VTTLLTALYVASLAGKSLAAVRAAGRAPQANVPEPADVRNVVVAQPILSGDPQLREALEANVRELLAARFVWLVDECDLVARSVAASIIEQCPDSRIEVILCRVAPDGVNPKLWKLGLVEPQLAAQEVLVVLDDDTRLPLPSLGALLTGLRSGTVATGLPAYLDRGPWQAGLVG